MNESSCEFAYMLKKLLLLDRFVDVFYAAVGDGWVSVVVIVTTVRARCGPIDFILICIIIISISLLLKTSRKYIILIAKWYH